MVTPEDQDDQNQATVMPAQQAWTCSLAQIEHLDANLAKLK